MLNFVGVEIDKKLYKQLQKIFKVGLKMLGQKPRILEATVEFVYSPEMQELNERTRHINEATDVLSFPTLTNIFNRKITRKDFPLDVNPENNKVYIGDIVINLDRVESQAVEFGHSSEREICYLFVHGLLHLMEYDHQNELDKSLMRSQEEAILSKFNLKRG